MERYAVPVLAEIDTRALVRHLRTYGVMRGVISTSEANPEALVQRARHIRKMDGTDLAKVVSTKSAYSFDAVRSAEPGRRSAAAVAHFDRQSRPAATWWLMTSASSRTSCACWRAKAAA